MVTDSLFIFDEHIKKLEAVGFEVERLDKPEATEAELIKAVKGKVGYILGGVEKVTKKVIDAADQLKVISFTGIGYKNFIPAWEYATKKGVAISNTLQGPTQEVAEWAITAALMMNREFLDLGRVGDKQFAVTKGLEGQKIGIIGLGRIGSKIADILKVFKPQSINYSGRQRHADKEKILGVQYAELSKLLGQSDIVFVCLGDEAQKFIGEKELKSMKGGALLVNITHPGIIVEEALFDVLRQGHIRAVSDYPMSSKFDELSLSHWYCMKSSNTITEAGSKLMSDMATESMINLLTTGKDQYRVN